MKKFYYTEEGTQERCMVCFSSGAKTPEEAMETVTMETAGPCLGPADADDETLRLLEEGFQDAEEMTEEETQERLEHLADEWGLTIDEIEYLK